MHDFKNPEAIKEKKLINMTTKNKTKSKTKVKKQSGEEFLHTRKRTNFPYI